MWHFSHEMGAGSRVQELHNWWSFAKDDCVAVLTFFRSKTTCFLFVCFVLFCFFLFLQAFGFLDVQIHISIYFDAWLFNALRVKSIRLWMMRLSTGNLKNVINWEAAFWMSCNLLNSDVFIFKSADSQFRLITYKFHSSLEKLVRLTKSVGGCDCIRHSPWLFYRHVLSISNCKIKLLEFINSQIQCTTH